MFGKQEASQLDCSHVLSGSCCVSPNGKRGRGAAQTLSLRNSSNQNTNELLLCVCYELSLYVMRLISLPPSQAGEIALIIILKLHTAPEALDTSSLPHQC